MRPSEYRFPRKRLSGNLVNREVSLGAMSVDVAPRHPWPAPGPLRTEPPSRRGAEEEGYQTSALLRNKSIILLLGGRRIP